MEGVKSQNEIFDSSQFNAVLRKRRALQAALAINAPDTNGIQYKYSEYVIPNVSAQVGANPFTHDAFRLEQPRRYASDGSTISSDDLYRQQIRRAIPSPSVANANRLCHRRLRGTPRVIYEGGTIGEI